MAKKKNPKILGQTKFSRVQILAVALVLGALGVVYIVRSYAGNFTTLASNKSGYKIVGCQVPVSGGAYGSLYKITLYFSKPASVKATATAEINNGSTGTFSDLNSSTWFNNTFTSLTITRYRGMIVFLPLSPGPAFT